MIKPRIDIMKCDSCGLCVSVCRHNALVLIDGVVAFVETAECDWCTRCEAVCIHEAITCPYEIVFA